jgi:hypothetical protein
MTRKVLFSVLVIGAIVAAVGLVTYAIFTDNVASDDQFFEAGTVDIVVNDDDDDYFETTLDMANMEAGDCTNMTLHVENRGTLDVNLWNWIYPWGEIFGCDPNPACNMQVIKTPIGDSTPPDHWIESGGFEDYDLEACLPLCAGNGCQGKAGGFRMFFHAVQDSNLDGYECVKLEDKAAPDWLPDPLTPGHGNMCFKQEAGDMHVVVNAYGLTPDACFQLSLDGGDMDDPNDGACTTQDDNLAGMGGGDLYVSGYWNWGTYLEGTCNPSNGGEGIWNYAGVYEADKICADSNGDLSWSGTLSGLPAGNYIVKQNVKEISNPWPGDGWTGVLSGLDYLQFTIP